MAHKHNCRQDSLIVDNQEWEEVEWECHHKVCQEEAWEVLEECLE